MYKIRTSEYRVGVVGLGNSGKTVLLTSLINHLKEHVPERFRLGAGGTAVVRRFRERKGDRGWLRFDYENHLGKLVYDGEFVPKTTDRAQFVCEFERSD